jgi:hypothetical protein
VLVAGLIAIPAIDQAHASNAISNSRNKGQKENLNVIISMHRTHR